MPSRTFVSGFGVADGLDRVSPDPFFEGSYSDMNRAHLEPKRSKRLEAPREVREITIEATAVSVSRPRRRRIRLPKCKASNDNDEERFGIVFRQARTFEQD